MESISLFALLSIIVVLGFLGQWFAWGLKIPSIVLLFGFGLVAGPITGFLSPDQILGDLLFPSVSILIGIILFEGGLTLEFEDIKQLHAPVLRVIFLGGAVTFLLTALFSGIILEFSLSLSFLLGAILVVTGPTVVIPLLQQIRPKGAVGSVARWEGIIIDPIGAMLTVIVFKLILAGTTGLASGFGIGALKFLEGISIGTVTGLVFGYVITLLLNWYWIPDYLHNLAIISFVLGAQAISNHFVHEAGLLAVTVMGMYLANQKRVAVRHILHFKEDLRVIFISLLFIILVARLDQSFISQIGTAEISFLLVLILFVRPAATLLSTLGTSLTWKERGFLSWLAPRGIVAAAMASLFATRLQNQYDMANAALLDDITFFVIAGTVLIYGFTLNPLANLLGLSETNPQGILMVGAQKWIRNLAKTLQDEGVLIRLIDGNINHIVEARDQGLNAYRVDVLTEAEFHTIDLQGIGHFLALTSNDEVNSIAVLHGLDMAFDRSQIFQLSPSSSNSEIKNPPNPLQGRSFCNEQFDYEFIQSKLASDWEFSAIEIKSEEYLDHLNDQIPEYFLPIFQLETDETLSIASDDQELNFDVEDKVVGLASPDFSPEKT